MKRSCLIVSGLFLFALPALADDAVAPPAEPQVSIKLPASTWNVIISGLSELPLKIAMPVINEIQTQAKPQLEPPKPTTVPDKPKK